MSYESHPQDRPNQQPSSYPTYSQSSTYSTALPGPSHNSRGYQPPEIEFEEEEDSDDGEAPASLRFEMTPLTRERHLHETPGVRNPLPGGRTPRHNLFSETTSAFSSAPRRGGRPSEGLNMLASVMGDMAESVRVVSADSASKWSARAKESAYRLWNTSDNLDDLFSRVQMSCCHLVL